MSMEGVSALRGRKLVFLGPSLGLEEARGICPDAEFHPPVRFGDLYALSCEPPGQVLIVDGVFHDDTPVWQREILDLLQMGWRVLGASSMGALRALELEPYGMIGLGTVFEWYRSGRIEGDDEVALMHGIAEMGWQPLTLPLVDVRHALAALEAEGALDEARASAILSAFKRMGHEERTLRALLALARSEGADTAAVQKRLSDSGRSLKAQDARLALQVFAGQRPSPAAAARWPDPAPAPVQAEAVLERRIHTLAGPRLRALEALQALAQQQPEALQLPIRESRRRWFLCDWMQETGMGPDIAERRAFALKHAAGLAQALGVSLSRWRLASGLREDELPECMAGLAIEAWLSAQTAEGLGLAHPLHGGETPLIPLVLVDWMRRQGVEAPPEHCIDTNSMAAWLVQTGPVYFGSYFHSDAALFQTLAANGTVALWGRRLEAGDRVETTP